MINKPAIRRATRGLRRSSTRSLPAPTGGWNARDPLAAMPEGDAVTLENWFPMTADVQTRRGAIDWVTGFASTPLTLMPWNGKASSKLFASTATAIYDVTSTGALGASATTCTSGYWSHVNFTTLSDISYLIAVNGVDKLKLYNGTTWQDIDGASTPAITGLATTSLSSVFATKRRVWFTANSSSTVYFLDTGAIGGALGNLPLGPELALGGYIVAIHDWTIDGGNGPDDYVVFASSEGEVVLYKGTDPTDVDNFTKVGTYYIGEPVNNNCFARYGGDVLYLCQGGLFPLSKALQSAAIDRRQALSAKIESVFNEALSTYGGFPGWKIAVFPQASFVLINVPITATYSQQFVMNSITGAWCKFTGWTANDWAVFGEKLYFASTAKVAKAWEGSSDFGGQITASAQQAFNYFGYRAQQKHFKLVRPILTYNGAVGLDIGLDGDYTISNFFSSISVPPITGSLWDSGEWDTALWAADFQINRSWATVALQPCYAAAFRLQCVANSAILTWSATDFVFEVGGVL